jgi:hypothetical protein
VGRVAATAIWRQTRLAATARVKGRRRRGIASGRQS